MTTRSSKAAMYMVAWFKCTHQQQLAELTAGISSFVLIIIILENKIAKAPTEGQQATVEGTLALLLLQEGKKLRMYLLSFTNRPRQNKGTSAHVEIEIAKVSIGRYKVEYI
jgi:hypothetical protein